MRFLTHDTLTLFIHTRYSIILCLVHTQALSRKVQGNVPVFAHTQDKSAVGQQDPGSKGRSILLRMQTGTRRLRAHCPDPWLQSLTTKHGFSHMTLYTLSLPHDTVLFFVQYTHSFVSTQYTGHVHSVCTHRTHLLYAHTHTSHRTQYSVNAK